MEDLSALLKKHFHKSHHSKLSIGISSQKEAFVYHFDPCIDDHTLFGLGSISKTLISTYICELVHQHKIDLSARTNDYLELKERKVYPKIIELLTHTSGYHKFIPFVSSMFILLTHGFSKRNIYKHTSKDWLTKSLMRIKPLKHKRYRYSDYNYAVLALVIEAIEKRPFKEVMVSYMQHELGMKKTCYGTYLETLKDPYSWVWDDENPFLPSGGLYSNIEDMMIFLNHLIVHKDRYEMAIQKYCKTQTKKQIYTGFSWNSLINGQFYWHCGGQGYYRSYVLFDVKKELSIVVLSTVDVNVQHVNHIGSSIYRNIKRNHQLIYSFLDQEVNLRKVNVEC